MKKTLAATLILAFGSLLIIGCSNDSERKIIPAEATSRSLPAELKLPTAEASIASNFAEASEAFRVLAYEAAIKSLGSCQALAKEVKNFIQAPSAETQAQAQKSYHPCHQSWVSTKLYFQRPFSLAEETDFYRLIDLVDTRPFLPGYIDGVPEYPYSGLVHEVDLTVNESTLRSQHRLMDEESAALGFPVVEFFLWRTPIEGIWKDPENSESKVNIERRLEYLQLATDQLVEQLSEAAVRWQPHNAFTSLPERAQVNVVLQSIQRLTMVELLEKLFSEQTLAEPAWFHPSQISGQGLDYPIAILTTLQSLLGKPGEPTAFSQWMKAVTDLPFEPLEMQTVLADTITTIEQLPANYPMEQPNSDDWTNARQKLAQLALLSSQLSTHYNIPIETH